MPLNVKCKNCNNYRNNWCERVIDSPDPDMVRDCRHFWEKTNADRIRAMSDEELALFVRAFISRGRCPYDWKGCENCWLKELCNANAYNGELQWLHAPAEGE